MNKKPLKCSEKEKNPEIYTSAVPLKQTPPADEDHMKLTEALQQLLNRQWGEFVVSTAVSKVKDELWTSALKTDMDNTILQVLREIGNLRIYNPRTAGQTPSADEDHDQKLQLQNSYWMDPYGEIRL